MIQNYIFMIFTVFYMGQATEKLFLHLSGDRYQKPDKTLRYKIFHHKPFICSFCMYFWWSLILFLLSIVFSANTFYTLTVIAGLAGMATLVHALKVKLESINIS